MRVGTSRLQVRDVRNTSKCLSVIGRFDQNRIADLLFSFTAGTLYPLPHDCGWKNYENSKFSIGFTAFSINNNTKNNKVKKICAVMPDHCVYGAVRPRISFCIPEAACFRWSTPLDS